ncbi:MAG: RNA polymerase sigma factor, partial [Desulfocucumaceae bacterium]
MRALTNETEIVLQAVSDSLAFEELFDHYFPRVYNYVRCRVGNSDVADDLTSHILERIYFKLDTYRPEYGIFAPWLFTIAQYTVTDYYRKQKR